MALASSSHMDDTNPEGDLHSTAETDADEDEYLSDDHFSDSDQGSSSYSTEKESATTSETCHFMEKTNVSNGVKLHPLVDEHSYTTLF